MTEIVPLDFEGAAVRMLVVDGEPWWLAADAAAILGIKNIHSSLALLDEDERGLHSMETPHGPQSVAIVSESGLYSLTLRSRRPQAKAFKRWITREVIPSIRKHGGYLTERKIEEALLDPDVLIRLATDLKAERAQRQLAEARADSEEQRRHALEPLAAAGRTFTEIKGTVSVAEAAGYLSNDLNIDIGRNQLFAKMRELDWICREGRGRKKYWRAKRPALTSGRLREFPNPYIDEETGDREFGAPTIQVSSKGLAALYAQYYGEAQGRFPWEDAG